MPRYKWDIKDLIFEDDVRKMYNLTDSLTKRAFISACWLTGARTSELLMLKKEDIGFSESRLLVRVHTLKLGDGAYKTEFRTLTFTRPSGLQTNIYIETLIKFVCALQNSEDRLFPYTDRWAESRVIGPISEQALSYTDQAGTVHKKWLTPYHFRHSVMQWFARHGASLAQLMHFKGAKSPMSVQPYISAVPSVIKMENLNRDRALTQIITKPTDVEIDVKEVENETAPATESPAAPIETPKPEPQPG